MNYFLYILFFISITFTVLPSTVYAYTILLDPAGDTLTTGRRLHDTYERSITYLCAEKMQEILQQNGIKTVLSRNLGQIRQPFHTAQLANKINVDLVIHITACINAQGSTAISIFYPKNHFAVGQYKPSPHTFLDINHTYQIHYPDSLSIATKFANLLKKPELQRLYTLAGPFGIPYKPLLGVTSASFAIELELASTQDIAVLGPLLGQMLSDSIPKHFLAKK